MLDPSSQFVLLDLPDVWIYADSQTNTRFYAVPKHPRVALDSQGTPEINLLLYKQRNEITGGQNTLTTDLDLTAAERAALNSGLQKRLADTAPPRTPPDQIPKPEILTPDWLDGKVRLHLTNAHTATGMPSLAGTNRCTFSLSLDAQQAKSLNDAVKNGLPGAFIEYEMHVQAAGAGTQTRAEDILKRAGVKAHTSVNISSSGATAHRLTLRGPLNIRNLSERVQLINLG